MLLNIVKGIGSVKHKTFHSLNRHEEKEIN